jgi:hypothetical protein
MCAIRQHVGNAPCRAWLVSTTVRTRTPASCYESWPWAPIWTPCLVGVLLIVTRRVSCRGGRVMRCVVVLTAEGVFFDFCCKGWRWLCASMRGTGAVIAAIGAADAAGASHVGTSCSGDPADVPDAGDADVVAWCWMGGTSAASPWRTACSIAG